MIEFYKDRKQKIIDPTLFSDKAEKLAERIAKSGEDRRGKLAKNKRSQLRKFFDEVVRLDGIVKADPKEWDNILPYINMLVAKAAYAEARNNITSGFTAFLKDSIAQVKDPKDMSVFTSFFEAFMGFYRRYGEN